MKKIAYLLASTALVVTIATISKYTDTIKPKQRASQVTEKKKLDPKKIRKDKKEDGNPASPVRGFKKDDRFS